MSYHTCTWRLFFLLETSHRLLMLNCCSASSLYIHDLGHRQTIHYLSRSKIVNTERRELARVTRGKIRSGEVDDWKNEQLFVPPLPPTNLRGCHLIKIQYDVFVSPEHASEPGAWSCTCLFCVIDSLLSRKPNEGLTHPQENTKYFQIGSTRWNNWPCYVDNNKSRMFKVEPRAWLFKKWFGESRFGGMPINSMEKKLGSITCILSVPRPVEKTQN